MVLVLAPTKPRTSCHLAYSPGTTIYAQLGPVHNNLPPCLSRDLSTTIFRASHPIARFVTHAQDPHRLFVFTVTITTGTRDPSSGEAATSPQSVLTAARSSSLLSAEVTRAILSTTADPIDSPYPPPFSSLYFPPSDSSDAAGKANQAETTEPPLVEQPPAFSSLPPRPGSSSASAAAESVVADTKAALPRDTKDREGSSSKDFDDGEPPPPYTEGSSPLPSFTYVMATAGGPASIITQVQQGGGGAPLNSLAAGM
jgi:ATP-binding cassette subfamily F protein 3